MDELTGQSRLYKATVLMPGMYYTKKPRLIIDLKPNFLKPRNAYLPVSNPSPASPDPPLQTSSHNQPLRLLNFET